MGLHTGIESVVVAVIDTGVLLNHADLSGRTVPGYYFISDSWTANDGGGRDNDPSDPGDWVTSAEATASCSARNSSWHGSHVAGTIGASSNNSLGITGINWNAKILPVRVLGKCGGYTSDIIDGVRWSAGLSVPRMTTNTNPAKVLNLSLGGPTACDSTWQSAINDVTAKGATVVVAAGNANVDASTYTPASCKSIITVAATNKYGSRAYNSNDGSSIEISAPGGDGHAGIYSTVNSGTTSPISDVYESMSGTSMAAPHVAGAISLLYAINPSLLPEQVLQVLQTTATAFPAGSTCTTSNCGAGIVNLGQAVTSLFPPIPFAKTSPEDSTSGLTTSLRLAWDISSNASIYDYCYDTNHNTSCDSTWNSTTHTSVSLSGLLSAITYY